MFAELGNQTELGNTSKDILLKLGHRAEFGSKTKEMLLS